MKRTLTILVFLFELLTLPASANSMIYTFNADNVTYEQFLSKSDGYISVRCNNNVEAEINRTKVWLLLPASGSLPQLKKVGSIYTGSVTIDTKEYETTCQEKSNGTVTLAIILANLSVDPGGTESYQYLVRQAQPGTYKISPFFIPKISLEPVR